MNVRSRRLRINSTMRRMVRETCLSTDDLIQPLFVCDGECVKEPVNSMPGVYRMSIDHIVEECKKIKELNIPGVLLFGIPSQKDSVASGSYAPDSIICKAVQAIKKDVPELLVITDVCACEYTDHGHCGILKDNDVDNDLTLELLCRQAVAHAKAGADIIAPSDMMDGRVKAIRKTLDANGFEKVSIMSYAVKYASSYYGPFREAAMSAPGFGDRKTYQMDPANRLEALKEAAQDINEGADMIMVKPALSYLDIVREVRNMTNLPVVVYNVSGEYSMIKKAVAEGWVNESIIEETLLSMKRAGADIIITYFAMELAAKLNRRQI